MLVRYTVAATTVIAHDACKTHFGTVANHVCHVQTWLAAQPRYVMSSATILESTLPSSALNLPGRSASLHAFAMLQPFCLSRGNRVPKVKIAR
mmetsp:Transcript_49669/g.93147  ORF Transcript_49669/g.93147 Transcript_49669/m.93147 type:complete len:93 (+) Transcript_49669:70-348(+)